MDLSKFCIYLESKSLILTHEITINSLLTRPKRVLLLLKEVLDVVIPQFVVDDCFYCENMSGPIQAHNIDLRNVIPMIYPNHGRECGQCISQIIFFTRNVMKIYPVEEW